MACCLMAPSHCLNQCWLIISSVLYVASILGHFQGNAQDIYPWYEFQNNSFKIITTSPRGQRVKETSGLGSHGASLLEKHKFYPLYSKVINDISYLALNYSEFLVGDILWFINAEMLLVVNFLDAIFFCRNINMYLQFLSFFHTDMTQVVEICSYLMEVKDPPILHSHYHEC